MAKIVTVMMSPTTGSASGKPSHTPMAPCDDRETGEPVHAGVIAVSDERRTLDLPADADPEHGDGFVADETDDAGGRHRPEERDLPGIDESLDGLEARHQRARQYQPDDHHAREILHAPVTVGEPLCRPPAREPECDPQRNGWAASPTL